MPESESLNLLRVLSGSYRPGSAGEASRLAERARLNKLYLAYLRALGGPKEELVREEARYRWFLGNAVEVVGALRGLEYALYKFRRPVEHVSVDLDVLVGRGCVARAVRALRDRGFRVVVAEPYTVTLERRGFIVDLYTEPAFAWVVYMDGGRLLREHSEDVELAGVPARGLSREAEVAVAAAHAVYKEHMVLLMDCLVAWSWLGGEAWSVAAECGVEAALVELLGACRLVAGGLAEAPFRLGPGALLRVYAGKVARDPAFRATLPNALRYVFARRDIGKRIVWRVTRRSY
ncbi:MAG: nucleotidyltransferase family protein [Thermofilum sp.]|nr:nucleotidyltransferase family protein [Thermofilum sp.]